MLLNLALLLAGIGALTGLAWWLRTPPPVSAAQLRKALVVLAVLLLVLLAATGRLHWLLALAGALLAAAVRLLPLLHYAPLLQRLWRQVRPPSAELAVARPVPSARRLNPRLSAYGSTMPRGRSTVRCWRALSRAIA